MIAETLLSLILRSDNWQFIANCKNGTDLVYDWSISGTTNPDSWHISPWLAQPITIRGVELTKISGGPTQWWMAGNSIINDTMLFLGQYQTHGINWFPVGLGMPMMTKTQATPKDYLDLHGSCEGTSPVAMFYTVYYTVDGEEAK